MTFGLIKAMSRHLIGGGVGIQQKSSLGFALPDGGERRVGVRRTYVMWLFLLHGHPRDTKTLLENQAVENEQRPTALSRRQVRINLSRDPTKT